MSNPYQDFSALQNQIQEINSQRTQNLLYLQSQGALETEIVENTKQASELAAMTQRGEDAGDNLEQYRKWAEQTFKAQNRRVDRLIKDHELRDSQFERSAKILAERLKNSAKEVISAFDPEHLAETSEGQAHTLLTMFAASTIATNFEKLEGIAHKISDYLGSGSLKETIGRIAGDSGENGMLGSLGKIIRAPFDYFVEWVKGELSMRAKLMGEVDIPTPKFNAKNLGKLQPFGNIITSLSNFLGDFVTALGDKLRIIIDPRSSITYQSNREISEMASDTREKKRNIDAKTKDWNERGLLYTKKGERNYGRFIPSVFQTPLGGLDGTHGSTLAASRELFGIVQEALTGNRVDTASFVDVFNKLWIIAKRNKYILVEECFLDSLENGEQFKKNPINIHVLRRKFRLDEAIIDAVLPFNLRDKKTIYLTDSEWNEINEDCKKDFEEICQVTVYKITLEDLEKIANGQFGLKSFDPDYNEEFIISASNWLESHKGGAGSDKEKELIERYTQEGMIDNATRVYTENREEYEMQKKEIEDKISKLNPVNLSIPSISSLSSTAGQQQQSHIIEVNQSSFVPTSTSKPLNSSPDLTPSDPGGRYPIERAGSKKTNPVTGLSGNTAYRNNNPGNIIWSEKSRFPGEIQIDNVEDRGTNSQVTEGFKTFNTLQAGFEGIYYNLDKGSYYFKSGNNTISKIIKSWCEGNPTYIRNLSTWMGVDKDTPLSFKDRNTMVNLAKAMYRQEDSLGFSVLNPGVVEAAYDNYMRTYYPGETGDDGGTIDFYKSDLLSQPINWASGTQEVIDPKFKKQAPLEITEIKEPVKVIEVPTTKIANQVVTSSKTKKQKTKDTEIGKLELDAEINSEKAVIEAIKTCIIEEVGNRIDITNSLLK